MHPEKSAMKGLTWGDSVHVLHDAANSFRPGEIGEVCGFHEYTDQTIYTVEFGDGVAIQIPESFLSKIDI